MVGLRNTGLASGPNRNSAAAVGTQPAARGNLRIPPRSTRRCWAGCRWPVGWRNKSCSACDRGLNPRNPSVTNVELNICVEMLSLQKCEVDSDSAHFPGFRSLKTQHYLQGAMVLPANDHRQCGSSIETAARPRRAVCECRKWPVINGNAAFSAEMKPDLLNGHTDATEPVEFRWATSRWLQKC